MEFRHDAFLDGLFAVLDETGLDQPSRRRRSSRRCEPAGSTWPSTSLVTAVISMARNLGLRVVAEGVETSEQLAFLQGHDCDEAQGFYFSKPLPAAQFAELLHAGIPVAARVPSASHAFN